MLRPLRLLVSPALLLLAACSANAGGDDARVPWQQPDIRALDDTSVPAPDDTSVPPLDDTSVPAPDDTSVPAPDDTSVPAPDDTSVPAPDDTSVPPGEDAEDGSGCLGTECPGLASLCLVACSTAADCPYTGHTPGGAYDQDNWSCKNGACHYIGCHTTAECKAEPAWQNQDIICASATANMSFCTAACTTAADCPLTQSDARFDADNYDCVNGACSYLGCQSDSECMTSLASTGLTWVCSDSQGFPSCQSTCATPGDCVYLEGNVLFEADNYACEDGLCRHIGCHSDAECQEAYQYAEQAYVCVD